MNAKELDIAGISALGTVTFDASNGFAISIDGVTKSSHLNTVSSLDITIFEGAQLALQITDAAINLLNRQRSKYGALQSRFEYTINNLSINIEK